jgi:hypothetical protein
MLDTKLVCGSPHLRLANRGHASNRWLMTCTPLTWLRLILFVARGGYQPSATDREGITPERAEEFCQSLERALLFTPEFDRPTQARAWRQMSAVPADTRLTHTQMALRECLFAMDRDNDLRGWSGPKTRIFLEQLRRFIIDEGGIRIERTP